MNGTRHVPRRTAIVLALACAATASVLAGCSVGRVKAGAESARSPAPPAAAASPTSPDSAAVPSTSDAPSAAAADPTAAPATTTAAPATTTAEPVRPVTIAFGGDVHAEGDAAAVSTTGLGDISAVLGAADIAVVNLETAIVTSSNAVAEAKKYTFAAPPGVLPGLAASGVDVASMANNHGMDYGRIGLSDTLAAIAANPTPHVIGLGADGPSAWTPYTTEVGGRSIGIISATDVLESASWSAHDDVGGLASAKGEYEEQLVSATAALAQQVDIAVVFLHWGVELQVCPTSRQQALATRLAAAGADIIAGSHAHVVQPVTTVGSATVAYGLGNFAWYHSRQPSATTGVLTVTVAPDDTRTTSWQPAVITDGLPVPQGSAVAVPSTGCG